MAQAAGLALPTDDWAAAQRFTVGAEGLAWWFKDSPAPVPVVTDGVLGQTGTHTLLGGQDMNTGMNAGFRVAGAYALSQSSALEANFFYFGSRSNNDGVSSSGQAGSTNLLVPYIDAVTHQEEVSQLSLAPVYAGNANEQLTNSLLGAEINGTWDLAPVGAWNLQALAGVRYLRLRETYTLTTQSPYNPGFGQDVWNTTDRFDTTNDFYGVQAGLRARFDQGRFFAGGAAKIALGAMAQSVGISGSLVTNDFNAFGPLQTFTGGYFALPTNIGSYSRTVFAAVPELSLNLGYHITPSATVVLGYSFMYASNVVRPGDQVNRSVNTSQSVNYTENPAAQLQGTAQPGFHFNDAGFWTQGISVGLVVRF
jgi:hypothetical protein